MRQKVISLYEYFFQISSCNPSFEFRPRDRELKMIENFEKKLKISYGSDWLFNYFCYQFSRYSTLKTRFGKGIVMLGWVVGDQALNKYKKASEEERYYGEKFKADYNLSNILEKPLVIRISTEYLDRERKRFYNTERGLLHCTENSLFDKKNSNCMFCKNKQECE